MINLAELGPVGSAGKKLLHLRLALDRDSVDPGLTKPSVDPLLCQSFRTNRSIANDTTFVDHESDVSSRRQQRADFRRLQAFEPFGGGAELPSGCRSQMSCHAGGLVEPCVGVEGKET